MKILLAITISLICISNSNSQVDDDYNLPSSSAKYFQDFLNFKAENGKTKLDVFIHVPYEDLQFVKTEKGFEASYSVTVSIYDEEKENLLNEKIWNEKITASGFEQSVAPENYNLSQRSFELQPGTYLVRTALIDKDSREEIESENIFTIRDLSVNPSLSDIMLISKNMVVEGSNKIVPNITRQIFADKYGIPFYFEVYADSAGEVSLEYMISNKDKEVLYQVNETKSVLEGVNQINYVFKDVTLNLGKYLVHVYLKDKNDKVISYSTKSFMSRWTGVPGTIHDMDVAVEQLRYIANPDEMEFINEAATNDEKSRRFIEFWKKRDPNPTNEQNQAFEEYYRRISYANENFSHYVDGWRSDRGMVLIILGLPDNIDRHPFEYDSKPYEVWEYYDLNNRFVFVDDTGFGDYRLITPLYGDMLRYRY